MRQAAGQLRETGGSDGQPHQHAGRSEGLLLDGHAWLDGYTTQEDVGQAKNEYVWDDVVNVLMIQLNHSYTPRTVLSTEPSASKWTRAFHVEQDNCEDTVLEDEDQHDPL